MPAVEIATKMPGRPPGAKPWLVKFAGPPIPPTPTSAQITKTATTSRITISFHHTSTLLICANSRTP